MQEALDVGKAWDRARSHNGSATYRWLNQLCSALLRLRVGLGLELELARIMA